MTDKQPVYIMPENVQRILGKDAQRLNIMAARLVADTVKSTLGPKGMDKMLVDTLGDVTVTNDGVTILDEMQIEHPAAKMMVEIAKTQEDEVGDGTTTAVIIAGKLLENAEKLLDEGLHPTVITRGYRMAAEKAAELLNSVAINVKSTDDDLLRRIAMTAMTGKGAEAAKDKLAGIIVDAVKRVTKNDNGLKIDMASIKLEKRKGKGIEDTELVEGIVLDKEKAHSAMPTNVKNAKIALIDAALEIKSPETDTKIQINNPEQLQAFLDQEEKLLKEMVNKVTGIGANVVLCQKGIDDVAQYYLAKQGIYAVRRIKKSDMEKIAKATGARVVSNLHELSKNDLGNAATVEEVKEGEDALTYITGCKNPKAVTILIRGGTEHVASELERAIKDGLGDVSAALQLGKIVAGGGAIEIELEKQLKSYGQKIKGRQQLAWNAFANALEVIPKTLAENAGLDAIDAITELKARHEKEPNAGLDLSEESSSKHVVDVVKAGIVEPMKVKLQAIKSASEVATMILRIDDVIASSGSGASQGGSMPQGAGMGGMPGMGGMSGY